jgi:hypothetical protein
VIVSTDTSLVQIKKHLKEQCSLGCSFAPINAPSKPHKIVNFELKDDLTVREVEHTLSTMFNVEFKLLNSDGYSIPGEYTLLQAKDDSFELEEDHNFNTKIQALKTISGSSSYSDIDWVKRVFSQTLRDAQTSDHFQQIEAMLESVLRDNEKFTQVDFDELYRSIQLKREALGI